MPIDSGIALQYRPAEFELPSEVAARQANLANIGQRSVLQQQAIRDSEMRYQQNAEKIARGKKLSQLLANAQSVSPQQLSQAAWQIGPEEGSAVDNLIASKEQARRADSDRKLQTAAQVKSLLGPEVAAIMALPPEKRAAAYQTARARLGVHDWIKNTPEGKSLYAEISPAYPGDEAFTQFANSQFPELMQQAEDRRIKQTPAPFTLKPGEQRFAGTPVVPGQAPGVPGEGPSAGSGEGSASGAPAAGQALTPIASVPPAAKAPTAWQAELDAAGGNPRKALENLSKRKREERAAGRAAPVPVEELGVADPASRDILSQTGLSVPGFYAVVGENSKLPRDAATRKAAMKEAGQFARKRGVDISTLASQYKTYNAVLGSNISRLNNTKIMESELQGTIENLQGVVDSNGMGRVNFVNVAKVWAGQQTNDSLAQQYAVHLSQLRNELTAYYAATQGRSGNQITLDDKREAEGVIRNGMSSGSLGGLSAAVTNSTAKMGKIMQQSVDRSGKAIWGLFGVGKNYKGTISEPATQSGGATVPIVQHSPSTGQYRYSTDGGKTWQPGQPK